MERRGSFHLCLLFCQKNPEQERAERSYLTNAINMLKACSFLCFTSPKSRGLCRVPKGSVEGVLQGAWGSSAGGRVKVLSKPPLVQYCTLASGDG